MLEMKMAATSGEEVGSDAWETYGYGMLATFT